MNSIVLSIGAKHWNFYLRDEIDQSVYNEIFKLGEYRAAEPVIKVARYPIVDVGAHAGFFSIWCRMLNESVPIVALEPEPYNLSLLKKHIADNAARGIEVVEAALARDTQARTLLVSADSHNHRLLAAGKNQKNTLRVQAFSFADLCRSYNLRQISLMKLDIEGGEYEVFASTQPDDFALVNFIILEYHNNREATGRFAGDFSRANDNDTSKYRGNRYKEIERMLREHGFGVQVFPSHFDKTMGFLFARNKRFKD